MADLTTNINQAISDFGAIKQAIINKGVSVPDGTPTNQYSNLIGTINSSKSSYITDGLIYCNDTSDFGTSELVETTINDSFLSSANEITYEIYFSYDSFQDSSNKGRVIEIGFTKYNLFFAISMNNNQVEFFIYHYEVNDWGILNEQSGITIPPNEKHTITCVVSDSVYLYVDGVLTSTFNKIHTFTDNCSKWYIKYKSAMSREDRDLNGIVYSTRIYNRGLSNDEILANHATDEQNY